jgi:SAM-dependent methyltransferase
VVWLKQWGRRFWSALAVEFRPFARLTRTLLTFALPDRLAAEDGSDKRAVIIGHESAWLADVLGIRKAQRLILPYPDFTPENLALLSDEYDFVIADRMLQRCERPQDAGHEMIRILKPGGWFACTACALDFAAGGSFGAAVARRRRLRKLFPHADTVWLGASIATWILGRKRRESIEIAPIVLSKTCKRRFYRFEPQPAKFGIMAMHRNEAPYLLEWIAHHRALGFSHITLYDNDSNDASGRILAPLAQAGLINVRRWRSRAQQQVKAHNHALERLRDRVEWCLYADVDEFLVLDPGCTLDDLLPKDPDVCGVGIPWRIFTAAGTRNRNTRLTIERFTRAVAENDCHVKSLLRLRDISRMGVHIPSEYKGRLIDISGADLAASTHGVLPKPAYGKARINHYFTRSWEEFEFKRQRGRAQTAGAMRPATDFALSRKPDVEVRDVLRYAPALVVEMERLRQIVGWNAAQ